MDSNKRLKFVYLDDTFEWMVSFHLIDVYDIKANVKTNKNKKSNIKPNK